MGFLHPKRREGYQLLADFALGAMKRAEEAGKLQDNTAYRTVALTLFLRAFRTLNAIRILCDEGYGEEALVLARSLLNIAIDLGYISMEDSDSPARRWLFFYGIVAREEIHRHPSPDDLSDVAEVQELGDEIVRRFPAYEKDARKGWSGLSIREGAQKSNIEARYWYDYVYWDLSSVEHADSFGTATTSFRTDKGRANYCTEPPDPWL